MSCTRKGLLVVFLLLVHWYTTTADYKIVFLDKGEYSYETSTIHKQIGECVTLQALNFFPKKPSTKLNIVWKKDTQSLGINERITISSTTLTITSLRPSDHAYYQAAVYNPQTKVTEKTEFWLHVTGCNERQQILQPSSPTACKNLCEDKCPEDWTYVTGTNSKCCQYFSTPESWSVASGKCQAIGGELTAIENDVENKFISSMLQTAAGGWIGLNDRESEGRYVWNFKQFPHQGYFTWDNGEPSNNNKGCNIENCVTMKKTNGKWIDVVCGAFYPFVCQVDSVYNGSDVSEWSCLNSNCYKFFNDDAQWNDAVSRCARVHSTAHLVTITSLKVNNLVQGIASRDIWIGLNDIREAGSYQWSDSLSSTVYKNWNVGEPNDLFTLPGQPACPGEDCVQIKRFGGNITWQDLGCDTKLPYICERVRDRAFSTGAYVGMVIGSFVLLSMIFGVIHAAFQKHKRTAVKDIIKAAYEQDIKMRDSARKTHENHQQKLSFRSVASLFIPNKYQEL